MSNRRKLIVVIGLIGVVCLFLLCAGSIYEGVSFFSSPLGPTLAAAGAPAVPAVTLMVNNPPAAAATPASATSIPIPTQAAPTAAPAAVCGSTGATTILAIGVDAPASNLPRGPLAIRLIRVDFTNRTAAVFALPRDLWMPVTGLEGFGLAGGTLSQIYITARNSAGYDDFSATNLLAQAISRNYGVMPNHYATMRLSYLTTIIDTVGGVDVSNPTAYDGTPYGLPFFPAGTAHMSGWLAMEYAMAPSAYYQWSGVSRQTQVLQALRQKVLSTDVLPRIPALIQQFLGAVSTDLSLQQILDFGCMAQQISPDRITWMEVDQADVTVGTGGALIPNGNSIQQKLANYFGN